MNRLQLQLRPRRALASRQTGATLLESLIAILIFTLGVLGLFGMQSAAILSASNSKYRTDASYLANQIVAQMWADQSNLASYSGATYAPRAAWDIVVSNTLPGASTKIDINNREAVVNLSWRVPSDTTDRKYVLVATINLSE